MAVFRLVLLTLVVFLTSALQLSWWSIFSRDNDFQLTNNNEILAKYSKKVTLVSCFCYVAAIKTSKTAKLQWKSKYEQKQPILITFFAPNTPILQSKVEHRWQPLCLFSCSYICPNETSSFVRIYEPSNLRLSDRPAIELFWLVCKYFV